MKILITATGASWSTGDCASSVRRVTPVKEQLSRIPGQTPTRKYSMWWQSEPVYVMDNMLQFKDVSKDAPKK